MHWLENENYSDKKMKPLIYLLELPPIHHVTIVEGVTESRLCPPFMLTHLVSDPCRKASPLTLDNKNTVVILSATFFYKVWQGSVPLLNVFDQVYL